MGRKESNQTKQKSLTYIVSYRCCLRYEGNSLILDSCGEDFDELKSKFEGGYSELQAHGCSLKN